MKPLILTLENINSYREKQTVDFSAFMQGGIFGIFGNTGSGKSTILDAIMLALYGEIPRSGARAGRSFINLQADRAEVTLTFACGERTFRAERAFRVRRSGVDSTAALYELTGEGEMMRAESVSRVNAACEELLGLNADEFKKVIAIPQGEFSALLKADPKDRLNMLGDLFNLEIYGDRLLKAVNEEARELEQNVKLCQAGIDALGDVSAETGKALEEAERESREKCGELEKEIAARTEGLKKAEADRERTRRLEACEQALSEAERQREELQKASARLERLEKFRTVQPKRTEAQGAAARLKEAERALEAAREVEKKCAEAYGRLSREDPQAVEERKLNLLQRQQKLSAGGERWEKLKQARQERKKKQDEYLDLQKKLKEEEKEVVRSSGEVAEGEAELGRRTERAAALRGQWEQACRLLWAQGRAEGFGEVGQKLSADKPKAAPPVRDYIAGLEGFLAERTPVLPAEMPDENRLKAELDLAEGQKEAAAKGLETARQDLTRRQAACDRLKNSMEAVVREGKILKEQVEEWEKDFEGITDPAKELGEVERELKALTERAEKAREEEARLKGEAERAAANREALEKRKEEAGREHERARGAWQRALAASGLTEEEIPALAALSGEEADDLRAEVQKGTSDLEHLQKNLREAQRECTARVSAGAVEELSQKLKALNRTWEEEKEKRVRAGEQLGRFRENLARAREKEGEKKKLLERLKLVQTLQELVKGRKLLEFAAEEYFVSVSAAATERLRDLTGGRYELHYRDRKFAIADNFAGGAEREVNTLSGGETFLVSLCLAVSLSEAIVSAGAKNLDFFFLDVGFGTLDEELFDSVMEALEQLQKTHFTIGVISHVPALRQRLSRQLIVEPADGERGSRVRAI